MFKIAILSDEKFTVRSPTFSPNGKHLVWLQRPHSGPIDTAHSLVKCNWATKQVTSVIDIVQDRILTENGKEFYGIYDRLHYGGNFAPRCWTSDSKCVLFSTEQKYHTCTYAVNIENRKIWDIGYGDEDESTILLDVSEDDYALFNVTSFKHSPALASLHIPSLIGNDPNNWFTFLVQPVTIANKNMISNFTVRNDNKEIGDCFATYYGPQNNHLKATPLIMYFHGGPHIATKKAFKPEFDLFIEAGFGILMVDYHGSAGIGQKYIDSLPGKMGSLDVEDCYNALQTALRKFSWLDPNKVVLYGGSTGGFLTAHLCSRYPNEIKGAVMRNPVTDVYLRCFLTDIPDWPVVQLGYPYSGLVDVITNPDLCSEMINMSPVKNIRKVKAPTLLVLGKKDLRIQPSMGLAYYHMLKEIKVPAKVLLYEDVHELSKVPNEMDLTINLVIWFKRCLKRNFEDNLS